MKFKIIKWSTILFIVIIGSYFLINYTISGDNRFTKLKSLVNYEQRQQSNFMLLHIIINPHHNKSFAAWLLGGGQCRIVNTTLGHVAVCLLLQSSSTYKPQISFNYSNFIRSLVCLSLICSENKSQVATRGTLHICTKQCPSTTTPNSTGALYFADSYHAYSR